MIKRLFFILSLVGIILLINLNKVFLPSVNQECMSSFSATNAEKDIEVISREPHSMNHPVQRATVREYLEFRLQELGYKPISYHYDTVINIVGVSSPLNTDDPTYILLLAHYDSRYKQKVKERYHNSLGAADDGYGLAVILELARVANLYKDNWKQGIKVLFTDSEELNLGGILNAIKEDPELFEDVSLAINLEARGVKGPALLFETSDGNASLIDLFSNASKPFGYSLTSSIYSFLPNYTDFSPLKEIVPGMNFSVIDNLNYYHTELDNFENISTKSIMHYGVQIEPMLKEFLTNKIYSDRDFFRSDSNSVFFTVPYFGLFSFGRVNYLILKILSFFVYVLFLLIYYTQKRISVKSFFISFLIILTSLIVSTLAGYGVSHLMAMLNGLNHKIINLSYISYEYTIFALSFIIVLFLIAFKLTKCTLKKRVSPHDFIFASIFILFVLSFLSIHFFGDSVVFFIPLFLSLFSLFALLLRKSKYICFLFPLLVLHFLIPLFYSFIVALTIGALLIILPMFSLYLWLIIPQLLLFIREDE